MLHTEVPFANQALAARHRLRELNRRAQRENPRELMPAILEELALLIDLLQTAEQLIGSSEQERQRGVETLDAEAQRHRDLFEHAPLAYFVTSLDGTIQRLNQAAVALLGTDARHLVGRSLALFIPDGERRAFRACFAQFGQQTEPVSNNVVLQTWHEQRHQVVLRTRVLRGPSGRPAALAWVVLPPSTPHEAPTE